MIYIYILYKYIICKSYIKYIQYIYIFDNEHIYVIYFNISNLRYTILVKYIYIWYTIYGIIYTYVY